MVTVFITTGEFREEKCQKDRNDQNVYPLIMIKSRKGVEWLESATSGRMLL